MEKEIALKVGDKVEIINDLIFNDRLEVGDVGTIIVITKDYCFIAFNKGGKQIEQMCDTPHEFLKKVD